jgi:PAS domain S-box-containing protein
MSTMSTEKFSEHRRFEEEHALSDHEIELQTVTRDSESIQQRLRRQEKKYYELFAHANDIIFTIDFEGNFTTINPAATRAYGYSEEEFLHFTVEKIVDPEHWPVARDHIQRKKAGVVDAEPYELCTRTRDGKPLWVEISSRLINDQDGRSEIIGIARDITERKDTLRKLKESERRFRETVELLPGVICEIDFNATFTYVNKQGLKAFGYSREEFERGITIHQVVHPEERERAIQNFTNIIAGDYGYPKEYRMLKRDGTVIHVLINTAPLVKDGKVSGVRSCLIDITERKRAQERLRRSEERFRSIFSHSPIGIALFSAQGNIVNTNQSFKEVFPNSESTGGQRSIFPYIDISAQELSSLRKGEGIFRESKVDAGTENGETGVGTAVRYFEWHITSLGNSEFDPSLFLAQVHEVTQRREAEKLKLQQAYAETEKANRLVEGLREEIKASTSFHSMVSRSAQMKKIFSSIPQMAHATATVLVTGESGTGKELIARSLHELGPRKEKPFIAINCSALPDTLLESELFGYTAGAFTDAKKDKPGKFALAEGGTLFLDEIGDISPAMQVKLLRVLQEKAYEPLGSVGTVRADVRIIAATNKPLVEMVKKKLFRQDLYYRINVLKIDVPPLRMRRCDIPLLCDHFVQRYNDHYKKNVAGIDKKAFNKLLAYDYPGNIRELENIIEHAFIFCKGEYILPQHLTEEFQKIDEFEKSIGRITEFTNFKDLERYYIQSMLDETSGNKSLAAQRMGIHKATLFRKMKALDIGDR